MPSTPRPPVRSCTVWPDSRQQAGRRARSRPWTSPRACRTPFVPCAAETIVRMHRFAAHVDLDAVRSNVAALRQRAGDAAVMAVVKADGYGHGMLPCARAAVEAGAGWLGVAFVEEGLALRDAGIDVPV